MVFVTARNQTVSAINSFIAQAREQGEIEMFAPKKSSFINMKYTFKNSYLLDFVTKGFGTHHAGKNIIYNFFPPLYISEY